MHSGGPDHKEPDTLEILTTSRPRSLWIGRAASDPARPELYTLVCPSTFATHAFRVLLPVASRNSLADVSIERRESPGRCTLSSAASRCADSGKMQVIPMRSVADLYSRTPAIHEADSLLPRLTERGMHPFKLRRRPQTLNDRSNLLSWSSPSSG